jgi:hypothetical protein
MRRLGLVAALILSTLALAACSDVEDSVQEHTEFASAAEAMEASADSFQSEVHSFEATMTIGFGAGDEEFSTTGEMKYEAPDSAYLKMDIPDLGAFEVLFVNPDFYFKMDDEWYTGDASALGIDVSEFEKYAQDHGPVDYAEALEGLKDLVRLSDEEIDGKMYWHYSGVLDLGALADELPDDVIDPETIDQAEEFLDDMQMDVYAFTMNMAMDFEKYNEDVDMPEVPTDAKPFDLLGDSPFSSSDE